MSSAKAIRAVLDTNVLVAAMRSTRGASYEVLQRWRAGDWKLVLSNTVVTEYEEILIRERESFHLDQTEMHELLDALCVLAERRTLPERPLPILTDPDDEPFVHLAVEAQVRYLITHNVRHLAAAKQHGRDRDTGEFLAILRTRA